CAEQILKNPLSAAHWRSAGGFRRRGKNRRLTEQPATIGIGDRHATEITACDVRYAVEARQPLVEKRVVGAKQIDNVVILTDDAVEEELGFAAHRLPQALVDFRKQLVIR